LQGKIGEFRKVGASVVGISVDPPATSKQFREGLKLTYPLLSDAGRTTIKAYNVHDNILDIAKPAVFVVDGEGVIRWKYVGNDRTDRPSATRVLAEAQAAGEPRAVRPRGKRALLWAQWK
jgi:peroxiredoxin